MHTHVTWYTWNVLYFNVAQNLFLRFRERRHNFISAFELNFLNINIRNALSLSLSLKRSGKYNMF